MSTIKLDPFQMVSAVKWGSSDGPSYVAIRFTWDEGAPIGNEAYLFWYTRMKTPYLGKYLESANNADPDWYFEDDYGYAWPYFSNYADDGNVTWAFGYDLAALRAAYPSATEATIEVYVLTEAGGAGGVASYDVSVTSYFGDDLTLSPSGYYDEESVWHGVFGDVIVTGETSYQVTSDSKTVAYSYNTFLTLYTITIDLATGGANIP